MRDHADQKSYGRNILGGRAAIPRMLEQFERHDIRATWATVGLLFCENRDHLMASLPPRELWPSYSDPRLSSYSYLDDVGQDETSDPYSFGASLISAIRQTPGQELGPHTFSHYYPLEPGQTLEQFDADLNTAQKLAQQVGVALTSIVFPRNQFDVPHLEASRRAGILAYRGNPMAWPYRATAGRHQTKARRALRLIDAYSGLLGSKTFVAATGEQPANLPASLFLRPCGGALGRMHRVHVSVIRRAMQSAARTGRNLHLWWHPHNFGADIEESMSALQLILSDFKTLRDETGMVSAAMGDLVG